MVALKKILLEKYPTFFDDLDKNLVYFAREIRKELRDEGHVVIGITGYPGKGKSNFTAILGMLIDSGYDLDVNICFIPTSKQIEETYMSLPMFSFFHIDEASRGLHKHKWHDKVQQKLNELYDTEREGHFLCTALLMPRFQNFTENFRNFMIKYWVNIPTKGLAVFYKRDEDKDAEDPWHIKENYKKKKDRLGKKRVFERSLPEQISAEQITDCYWFYCQIPPIPKEVWNIYQELKKASRNNKEAEPEVEGYKEKLEREKLDKWNRITSLRKEGKTYVEISAVLNISPETVRRNIRQIEAYNKMRGGIQNHSTTNSNNIIYNHIENDNFQAKQGQVEQSAKRGTLW